MDSSLRAESNQVYVDWETWLPTGVGGPKLNASGSILYQPLADGIGLIARNTGRLLYRIQIPDGPVGAYDPLVVGPQGDTLAVITSTGISPVDLSSLPASSGVSQAFPYAVSSDVSGSGTAVLDSKVKSGGTNRPAGSAHRPMLKFRN